MKIAIALLLIVALVSSGFGTWWSTRPALRHSGEEGLYIPNVPDGWWETNRGALLLGAGLMLTTIAGLLALTL